MLEEGIPLRDGSLIDIVDEATVKNSNATFVRKILLQGKEMSRMKLKVPKEFDQSEIDSSKWMPDTGSLDHALPQTIVIEDMFTSDAMEISRDTAARIVIIGLAAGYMNSYLHQAYPKMNITVVEEDAKMVEVATKWFNLTLDDRHSVDVIDGVEFVERAVKEGRNYDAILIEASVKNTGDDSEVKSPTKKLYSKATVEKMAKLLKPKGVLVIHVRSTGGARSTAVKEMQSSFKKSFRKCALKEIPVEKASLVLTCSNHVSTKPYNGLRARYVLFAKYPDTDEQVRSIKEILNTKIPAKPLNTCSRSRK